MRTVMLEKKSLTCNAGEFCGQTAGMVRARHGKQAGWAGLIFVALPF